MGFVKHKILALTAAATLVACAQDGADVKSVSDVNRIVSLGGDLTEIVYELGAGDQLVARDSTSYFPESVADLPDVGYVRALNAEGILALGPTLVIASSEAGPPEAIDQIKAAGVTVVVPPSGFTKDALLQRVEVIGSALGRLNEAQQLEESLDKTITRIVEAAETQTPPSVLFLLNGRDGSPMAAGTDTAAQAMIELAGGRNVFDSHSGYKAYSFEAMADAKPDVIMMMDHSLAQMGGMEVMKNHPAIGLTPAAQTGRIIAMDGTFMLGFGPRLPNAIEDVAKIFKTVDAS